MKSCITSINTMTPYKCTNIRIIPSITPDELYDFYEHNNICEVGFEKEVAARILEYPHLIVDAYDGQKLIGLARIHF